MRTMREWLAFWLLDWALELLPVSSSTREGMLRGLKEQREYDRYEGYCQVQRVPAVSFGRWRELRDWLLVKSSGAESTNATLRASGRVRRNALRPAHSRS